MKKPIIALAITTSLYSMANFVMVADESYKIGRSSTKTIISNWDNTGSEYCENNKEQMDVYFNKDFDQIKTCYQNQERTISIYDVNYNGEIASTPKETTTETRKVTNSTTTTAMKGIHIENDCEDIILNGYSSGDGLYRVGFNNSDVYCDMTRNGGGWMRITNYDFNENPDNIPPNMVKTVNRTLTIYTGASFTLRNGWYRKDVTSIPSGSYSFTEIESNTNGFAWKQSMIEIDSLQEITPDSYNVATTSRDSETINGQYLDGISLTYGNAGSRKHIHSLTRTGSTISRTGLEWLVASGDHTATMNPDGSQKPMIIFSKVISPTTEKISARLMLNQLYNDEKIGFTKYKVWVK